MTKMPKKTMTRATLIQELAQRCYLNPVCAKTVVDLFFQQITTALAQDKMVTLRRFGFFTPKVRSAYKAHNPKTGQKSKVAPKKLVSFKASAILLKDLNQGKKI